MAVINLLQKQPTGCLEDPEASAGSLPCCCLPRYSYGDRIMRLLFGWALFFRQCSWCNRWMMPKLGHDSGTSKFVSHSMCKACAAKMEGT